MNGRKTFSKAVIKAVFKKERSVQDLNPNVWRRDVSNEIICFPSYGDTNSSYGWNIHHADGNKNNNTIGNLIAVHYKTHEKVHNNESIII